MTRTPLTLLLALTGGLLMTTPAAAAVSSGAAGTAPKIQAADNTRSEAQPFDQGGLLGGGRIGTGVPGSASTQSIWVRLSADFKQLNIHAVTEGKCEDGGTIPGSVGAYNVQIATNGAFVGQVPYETSGTGGSRSGTFSYSGTVSPDGTASGSARLRMTINVNGQPPFECDSGTFKWVARDPSSRPGVGTIRKKAAYYGTRSDNGSVGFRVDSKGTRVSSFVFDQGYELSQCSGGQPIVEPSNITLVNHTIKKGTFSAKRDIERRFGSTTVNYSFRLTGAFGSKRATGTLSFKITGRENGQVVSSCDSGKLTWRAER